MFIYFLHIIETYSKDIFHIYFTNKVFVFKFLSFKFFLNRRHIEFKIVISTNKAKDDIMDVNS